MANTRATDSSKSRRATNARDLRRDLVEPLRVVDKTDQGLLLGDVGQEAQHRQPDKEAICSLADRQAEGRAECLVLRARETTEVRQQRRAQLVHAGECQFHLRLHAGCPQDPTAGGARREILQQRRLAHAGLPAQDQNTAVAGAHVGQQPIQNLALIGLPCTAHAHMARLHADHGVDLVMGVGAAAIIGSDEVAGVVLEDGRTVHADTVVLGAGVTPNVSLAVDAGLAVDGGVLVDASLAASHPDVYAVGDIANAIHPLLGRRVRVEHWANALHQGLVGGANAAGRD